MRPAFVLALALLASCGDAESDDRGWAGSIETVDGRVTVRNPPVGLWGAGEYGRMSSNLRIGALEGDGPDVFGDVTGIAVSLRGEIAVLDGQAQAVRVFGATGEYLRTIGRKGAGPGEFDRALAIHFDQDDRLWVVDAGNARYEVFDPEGRRLRRTPRGGGSTIGDPGAMTEGGLLDPLPHFGADGEILRYYVRVDSTGVVVDSLAPVTLGNLSQLRGVPAALAPFIPRVLTAADWRGDLWLASSDRYTLYRRGARGDTSVIAMLDVPEIGWGRGDQATVDSLLSSWPLPVDQARLGVGPQYLRSMSPDEYGNLYVRSNLPRDVEGSVFVMFDARGRYLGPVRANVVFADRPRVLFRGGAAYGVSTDEFGVEYVVRAQVQIPGGPPR